MIAGNHDQAPSASSGALATGGRIDTLRSMLVRVIRRGPVAVAVAVAMALVTGTLDLTMQPARAAAGTDACKQALEYVLAGQTFTDALLCDDETEPGRASTSTSFDSNDCPVTKHYLTCGKRKFTLVFGSAGLPALPAGLRRVELAAIRAFREARNRKYKDAPAGAVALLDEAVKKDPTVARFWHARGLVRAMVKRPADGLADLDRAIELMPQNHRYPLDHAWLRARAGDKAGAIAELRALDKRVEPGWKNRRQLLGLLADMATEAGAPEAAADRQRACQAGATKLCESKQTAAGGPPASAATPSAPPR